MFTFKNLDFSLKKIIKLDTPFEDSPSDLLLHSALSVCIKTYLVGCLIPS